MSHQIEDPRKSAQYLLFENHFANIKDDLTWTVDRLRRLAAALQLTEWEIGALIRVRITDMTRYMRKNQFPGTVELHLSLLERTIFLSSKAPVFPTTRC